MDEGQLEERDGRWELVFVRDLDHPREKVWRAVTEDEHLAHWFPFAIRGERAAGAPLRFTAHGDPDDPGIEGEMLVYDPPATFEFRWDAGETLRVELEPHAGGTRLTLTNRFDTVGKAARDGAGWHVCLENLAHLLDGGAPLPDPGARWTEVHRGYVTRFGPEASTIGPPPGHEPA